VKGIPVEFQDPTHRNLTGGRPFVSPPSSTLTPPYCY